MSYHSVLHVSVRMNCHQALFLQHFRNIGTYEHAVTELKKEGIKGGNRRRNYLSNVLCF